MVWKLYSCALNRRLAMLEDILQGAVWGSGEVGGYPDNPVKGIICNP